MSRRRRLRLARTFVIAVCLVVGLVVVLNVHPGSSGANTGVLLRAPVATSTPTSTRQVSVAKTSSGGQTSSFTASERAKCAGLTAPHEVVVVISTQRMYACQASRLVFLSPVTTGDVAEHEATPTGTWKIYAKQTDRWLSGPGYDLKVHFWMPFYGGYGFHDSPWQTEVYGGTTYKEDGSHGCVHMPLAAMTWLYAWAPIGTVVHVEA